MAINPFPSAVLFVCTMNSVRSPMAATLMRCRFGSRIYVESAGVRAGERDGFMIDVMREIGADLTKHVPRVFGDLEDNYFDLIITLSPEAHHCALEWTRTSACDVEYWPTMDPTIYEGNREFRLSAYRDTRDQLQKQITMRFPEESNP